MEVQVSGSIQEKRILQEDEVLVTSRAGVTGAFTEFSQSVYNWADDAGVEVNFQTKWSEVVDDKGIDYSIWQVPNPQDQMLFSLRWEDKVHGKSL